jgi:FMN-dependent NADH-azoreductase
MSKLLHIIASPRGAHSRSIEISNQLLTGLKGKSPELSVTELDLFKVKLPEVYGDTVKAKYTLMGGGSLDEGTQNSWEEIARYSAEFLSYDYYVITNPMWNFTIPYKLKHYIDVIMQAGILFRFTENGVEGLAKNKKMFCVTSRGNDYSQGTYMHQFDFQEPYLRSIFGLAGISDVTFINAQPMDIAAGLTQTALDKAKEQVASIADQIRF